MVPARIYTFSAVLALAAAALWAKGPFLNASPIRHLTNQPEMFAVVCVLTVVTVWQPVMLHYRGNSYIFVLSEIPLLLGLVFLSPRLFVLGCVLAEAFVYLFLTRKPLIRVTFNIASEALLTMLGSSSSANFSGRTVPSALQGWGSLAAAGTFIAIASTLVTKIVMRLNGQNSERWAPLQFTTRRC